jgi:hypothetical protein
MKSISFLGFSITELTLLTIILIILVIAIRLLLKTKPLQINWLIIIIIAPILGALLYILFRFWKEIKIHLRAWLLKLNGDSQ